MKGVAGLVVGLLLGVLRYTAGLSFTVNEQECVYENVEYEGDNVSGNFVVVDHDIFWASDHPGIDLTVSCFPKLLCTQCDLNL